MDKNVPGLASSHLVENFASGLLPLAAEQHINE